MMKKQKSSYTLSSFDNLSEWQASSVGSYYLEDPSYQSYLWPEFAYAADQISSPQQGSVSHDYDYNAAGDISAQNAGIQNGYSFQSTMENSYQPYDNSWNTQGYYSPPEVPVNESYTLPVEDATQYYPEEPHQQQVLEYGVPTVTDYGAVAVLLRNLIRVDMTPDGSVSVYNFPAMSVATLNSVGNKCFVKHPNGRIYQNGSLINIMTGNGRQVKISRKGIMFSSGFRTVAYFVDESGTKTTTAKFTDLREDLTADIFFDGNTRNSAELAEECHRLVSGTIYESYTDDSESWMLGGICIRQDRWGEVTVIQANGHNTISTSPTIRRMSLESHSVSIRIDCYSKNYLTVKKGLYHVFSGYCGLYIQNRSQKAGLDRNGRLVLF